MNAYGSSIEKRLLLFLLPAAALVLLLAASLFFAYRSVSPFLTLSRALGNFYTEAAERIDATPLRVLEVLPGSAENGTFSVDFDFFDVETGDSVNGLAVLSSDSGEREYSLDAGFEYNGMELDFEAYINRERVAARSLVFDDKYYGFRYISFRDDIRDFGRQIGLPEDTMDLMADVIEGLGAALNADEPSAEAGRIAYSELISDFLRKCEVSSERVSLESGSGARCTKVSFVITEEALHSLMNGVIDLLESDEGLSARLSIPGAVISGVFPTGVTYDDFLREVKASIRIFERSYSGGITLSFYIGRGGRLLRIEADGDVTYNGDPVRLRAAIDFGASVHDQWEMIVTVRGGNIQYSLDACWNYRDRSGTRESTVFITVGSGASLTMNITAAPESNIKSPEFINLDLWTETFTVRLEELIDDLVAGLIDSLIERLVKNIVGDAVFQLLGGMILEALGEPALELIGSSISGLLYDTVFDLILGRDLIYGFDRASVLEIAFVVIIDPTDDSVIDMILELIGDSLGELIRDLVGF